MFASLYPFGLGSRASRWSHARLLIVVMALVSSCSVATVDTADAVDRETAELGLPAALADFEGTPVLLWFWAPT